jgi:hypothetical protein
MTEADMQPNKLRLNKALAAGALVAAICIGSTAARTQELFRSPEDAVNQLVTAVRAGKANQIISVLGESVGSRQIVNSGDPVADKNARNTFITAYDARHRLVGEHSSKRILLIGDQDWPFPVPIVPYRTLWRFDPAAGREEILFRRIGRNELNTIQVCLAYVDAQNEYASANPEKTPVAAYAQRFVSRPGKKDGLYWPDDAQAAKSPLGEAAAAATREGYQFGDSPIPYHGYYYKILTSQSAAAAGGAINYVVKDRMVGGFALIAYPAEYGNSGVMTFIVNHAGVIYQKDLGSRTYRLARRINVFSPDGTWKKVPESDLAQAKN